MIRIMITKRRQIKANLIKIKSFSSKTARRRKRQDTDGERILMNHASHKGKRLDSMAKMQVTWSA